MDVTRNVITDLLPAYLSGDASPDTRTLVEEFLRRDPELQRHLDEQRRALSLPAAPPARAREADAREADALERTRRALHRRSWLLGFALAFTFAPLSCAFDTTRGLSFLLLRDAPPVAGVLWAVAILCWALFARSRAALRPSGI